MKKLNLFSLILVLMMVLAMLAGCGNEKTVDDESTNTQPSNSGTNIKVDTSDKNYITSKDAFVNKMAEFLDVSLYNELNETESEHYTSYYYNLDYENEKDYDLDYTVKLGDGTEFTMPISFSELKQKGWSLSENSSPDYELKAGYATSGIVENAAGKTMYVQGYNPTDETVAFKECSVINVELQQYSSDDPTKKLESAIDFTVCGSLTNAATLEDIINKLGNPTSVNCTLWRDDEGNYKYSDIEIEYVQDSDAYSNIVFELSGDGNYITNLHYDVSPEQK